MPAVYYEFDDLSERKGDRRNLPARERASGCVRDLIPCRLGRGSPRWRPGGTCVSRGLYRRVRWPSLQRSLLDGRGRTLLGQRGVRGGGGRGRSQFASSEGRRAGAPLAWLRRVLAFWETSVEFCRATPGALCLQTQTTHLQPRCLRVDDDSRNTASQPVATGATLRSLKLRKGSTQN